MTEERRYNSTLAGKGAYLPETKTVLEQIAAGRSIDDVRDAVTDGDLLDKRTLQSRENYWKEIFRRYISERDPEHVATLAQMVARCPNTTAVDLILFYEYCQVDALLYDLTTQCTYELYQDARTAIDKLDIAAWFKEHAESHPEIEQWAPSTRGRLISSYLSHIRDFGLVKGVRTKEFYNFYVPREAFVYALYHQKDRGLHNTQLIEARDWRLFLMTEREVIFMLEDAARGGFVHFRRAGDIFDLRFVYEDLIEVVDAITD